MSSETSPSKFDLAALDAEQIKAWLLAHPDFLLENPEILESLTPPQQQSGGDHIEDFQHHMLRNLQSRQQRLKAHMDELITNSRANVSTQAQIQRAVLALVRCDRLDSLLQTLTQDFMALFDVDVVRLALETPLAEFYQAQFSEENYSGISALPMGSVDYMLGEASHSIAIEDTRNGFPEVIKEVFASCAGLIRSCILLRVTLAPDNRQAVLAFGVRHPKRFHPDHADDGLQFLSQILALRLVPCLKREGLEEL